MGTSRRAFLAGAATTALAAACRATPFIRISQREVVSTLPGLRTVEGAGVQISRFIGQPALHTLDPFILLDRMHSSDPAEYVRGFPNHPHRGFETVSVMLDGNMRHRDSRGNHGRITGGGAQWMTAGRGIVHSEMPEQERGWLSGFQMWVNLPASEKMGPQFYQDLSPHQLNEGRLTPGGSRLRLIAGHVDGLTGPVRERPTEPLLGTLDLEDDRPVQLELPERHTAWAFVAEGAVTLGPEPRASTVSEGALAVLGPGSRLIVRSPAQRSVVLIGAGRPLGEPIVQRGPFVMNTEAEIQRAWDDYRAGVLEGPR